MKNIVFFSRYKKDTYSPRLLAFMKTMPFRREFIYYCVDPDPNTRKRNDELLDLLDVTEVPTLYVAGKMFVGEDAVLWLREQAEMLQSREPPATEYRHPQQGPSVVGDMYQPDDMQPPPRGMGQPPMGPRLPGMGAMPSVGGFAGSATGGRMPGGLGVVPQQDDTTGLNPMPGGGDSPYADPFSADSLSGGRVSVEQFLTPQNTKNQDGSARMDDELKRLTMERDSIAPQSGAGGGGLPGFGGRGMQELQMPMRR